MQNAKKSPTSAARHWEGKSKSIQGNYSYAPASLEEFESALQEIPSDDRQTWLKVGMALKAELGEQGFQIWNEWSKSAGNYREPDALAVWKSIKTGKTTIKTLFGLAHDAGWKWTGKQRQLSHAELEQRAKARAELELTRQRELADIAAKQARTAIKAQRLWESATPCENHPYLAAKRVKSHLLRVGVWTKHILQDDGSWRIIRIDNTLLIPLIDDTGKIWNIQGIFLEKHPDIEGTKHFLSGGRKSGLFFPIGKPKQTVLLCEGYATGASLFEATGYRTFIAFDCGNLTSIAKTVRKYYPDRKIIICADNDTHLENNPGYRHAMAAGKAIGGFVAVPPQGDWNDVITNGGELWIS